jgi:hypothetical protein
MKTKICKNPDCKKEFTPMYNSLEKYCSYECVKSCSKPDIRLKTVYSKPIVKKCKICKEKFEPKNISTEVVCGKYDCKVDYAMQVVAKNKIAKEKEQRRKNSEDKKRMTIDIMSTDKYRSKNSFPIFEDSTTLLDFVNRPSRIILTTFLSILIFNYKMSNVCPPTITCVFTNYIYVFIHLIL